MAAAAPIDALRALLAQSPSNVVAAYLFGSQARGEPSAQSDVDLAVLLDDGPASTLEGRLLDYEAAIERSVGRPVQLVILNDAPVDLAIRVLRGGRLLLDRNRPARLRFEVHTRNLYFDLLPFLTRYRQRALARATGSR